MSDKKYIIGITDFVTPPIGPETDGFPEAEFVFLKDWRESEQALEEWRSVDGILIWHYRIDRETAGVLDNCTIAVRYGAGYDVVDVEALRQRGIVFCNTPGCGTTEVADTACAMILSLQRKIFHYNHTCKQDTEEWQKVLAPIHRTNRSVLGIVGLGRIGYAVFERMRPFGWTILGYDPQAREARQLKQESSEPNDAIEGLTWCDSLEEMAEKVDVLTLHAPLNDETKGMIDARFIARMKKGACIVNCARGGIFDGLDPVMDALQSGRLAAVAMDVLPNEPPGDHPLITAWRNNEEWLQGRLIITPHVADYSEEGWYEVHYKAAETTRLYLTDGTVRNRIV